MKRKNWTIFIYAVAIFVILGGLSLTLMYNSSPSGTPTVEVVSVE